MWFRSGLTARSAPHDGIASEGPTRCPSTAKQPFRRSGGGTKNALPRLANRRAQPIKRDRTPIRKPSIFAKIDQIKRRHVRPSACCSRHSIDRGLNTSWPIIEYWRRQRTPSPIDCPCRKLIARPRSATNARALFGTLSRVSWSSSSESCVAIGGDVETYRDRRRPPPDRQRHSRSPRCPPSRGHRHRIRRRLGAAPRPARDAASSRAGGPS